MLDTLVVKFLVLKMWLSDDHGQDMLEYAMLGGLIVIGILAVTTLLTGALQNMVKGIANCIDFNNTTVCSGPF
ncbi:MAG: hypothetical protein ABSC13_01770 [Dehalococcoidia bacterium]|jgi:Flp pilus assembly pilin Flp